MEDNLKIVDFAMYCPACKHVNKKENSHPCNECLSVSARINSHKPEKWEEQG